jgi:amino acid transporter
LGVGKSLFFSMVACWKNKWALSVFALGWMALMLAVGFVLMALGAGLGAPSLAAGVMMPALLCVACMFFSSLYFTFQESFAPPDAA